MSGNMEVYYEFQLTPPHGGRRGRRPGQDGRSVSTHAPAWGATSRPPPALAPASFNSRPRMGGDMASSTMSCGMRRFNSRPRMGGDDQSSPHAPYFLFQLTPPHGGRPRHTYLMTLPRTFQLTPPHGGRRCGPRRCASLPRFNSRPRMGGDPAVHDGRFVLAVSTHAPAWGATSASLILS